jgi:hypothetical protein
MLYAVTIEPLNSVAFLADRPEEGELWTIEEGIELDLPPFYFPWPEGTSRPEELLYVSTSNPKHYKLFKNRRGIDPAEFQEAGKRFGGVFSKSTWERFSKTLEAWKPFFEIPDDEPLGATGEAISALKREG